MKHLANLTSQTSDMMLYVATFGPRSNSPSRLISIDCKTHSMLDLGTFDFALGKSHPSSFLSSIFGRIPTRFRGIVYYGHGSGIFLGHWNDRHPLMTLVQFVDHVVIPTSPEIVIFDACHMGSLSTLYELTRARTVKYVVASPSYAPTFSVIQTDAFKTFSKTTKSSEFVHNITCEFQARSYPKYSCLHAFDMHDVPTLVDAITDTSHFRFERNTQIHRDDPIHHDLWSVLRDHRLKHMVAKISSNTCPCPHIHGMSIANYDKLDRIASVSPRHLELFRSSMLYRKLTDASRVF